MTPVQLPEVPAPSAWAMTDYQPEANTQFTMRVDAAEHYASVGLQVEPLYTAAQLREYATEAVRLHVEAVEDRAGSLLRSLGDWSRAYPEDVFSEPTGDERAWLQAERRGLQDRIAASMGRHMARMIEQDLAALRALLTQPEQNSGR